MQTKLKELKKKFNLRDDLATRLLYSTDASIYRCVPLGVFFPRSELELIDFVNNAISMRMSILPRSAGTSLNGQAITNGIIVDMNSDSLLEINDKTALVSPGIVLDRLNNEANKRNLRFGPMPASSNRATIAGLIGNNGTGAHSIIYGMAEDHLLSARVLLPDGSVRTFKRNDLDTSDELTKKVLQLADKVKGSPCWPRTWRTSSGLNIQGIYKRNSLLSLFAGAEGELGIILEIEASLVDKPHKTQLALFCYDSLIDAMKSVPELLATNPSAVELMDETLLLLASEGQHFKLKLIDSIPPALLVVEYEDRDMSDTAKKLGAKLIIDDPLKQQEVWNTRKEGLGILLSKRGRRRPVSFIEDYSVPVDVLPQYVARLDKLLKSYGTRGAYYGHASAGCLHIRPLLDISDIDDRKIMMGILDDTVELIKEFGGSLAGEHGDGKSKKPYLERIFGTDITQAFSLIQKSFDPYGIFKNNSKTYYRADYKQKRLWVSVLDWQDGYFEDVSRCNGEATCKKSTLIMCPSYQVTGDETLSTRGRANLLNAYLAGEDVEKELDKTLSKCLACKGCSYECPSKIDMSLMKAEYCAHRPKHLRDYFYGHFNELSRLGRIVGGKVLFPSLVKRIFGIHQECSLPYVNTAGFLGKIKPRCSISECDAILFVDTHIEYYEPEIGFAAMKLFDSIGVKVYPLRKGCCGRPAFSRGLLDKTRKDLMKLRFPGKQPIIVIEPSCYSMLKNDAPRLLPEIKKLSERVISVESFLLRYKKKLETGFKNTEKQKVYYHAHCHQAASRTSNDVKDILSIVCEVIESDAGCCGMAGSFGYEKENHKLSLQIANDRFIPFLKKSGEGRIALPGRSCREMALYHGIKGCHPLEILADLFQ